MQLRILYVNSALFLLSISLVSCSHLEKFKTPTNEAVSLNSSLIQDYTKSLLKKESFKAPFIASYIYGDKNLVFVAAEHVQGVGSLTHKTIDYAFDKYMPEFLIVEGSAFTIVSDPDDIAYANECEKKNYKYCAEDAYAINLALKENIPFSYGDPSDAAIHSTLKKAGVKDDELIAFYALKKNYAGKSPLQESLAYASKKFRAKKTMSEPQFKKLFKLKMGREFRINEINDQTIGTEVNPDSKWSNLMAQKVDTLQVQFLTKQIESRLNKYKKVLVVYTNAHLVRQRLMLDKALGASVDESLWEK